MIARTREAEAGANVRPGATGRWSVVADLHLAGQGRGVDRLEQLLDECCRDGRELFVLGDFFHYWFGRRHLSLPMYHDELAILRSATGRGLKVWIIPGNRDFLLDATFMRETGTSVLGDDIVAEIAPGERVHLSHGDLFGTADVRYQRMRRVLRSRAVRFLAHHLPAFAVQRLARRLRSHSEVAVRTKSAATLEPDREMIGGLFQRGIQTVICGHFHSWRDESFPPELGGGRLIILEPFETRGFVLEGDAAGWSRRWIDGDEE